MTKLDQKDEKIINQLKINSRQSVRDIAKKTKLRPSTVHTRIQKLIKNEVIDKFTINLNNKKLGNNFVVFILVKTTKNIPNSFFENQYVKEVFGVTGQYDLLFKCRFKAIEEFNDFVLELRNMPSVIETHTMVGTINLKEEI